MNHQPAATPGKNDKRYTYSSLTDGAYDIIVEAARAGGFDEVLIQVKRRQANGNLLTIPGKHRVSLEELLDWDSDILPGITGGGNFECEAFHPHTPAVTLARFRSQLDGPPKFVPANQGRFGAAPPPPEEQQKRWLDGLPAHQRAAFLAEQRAQAPLTTYATDQVLAEQLAEERAQLRKIREEREAEAAEVARKQKALEAELAEMKLQTERARSEGAVKALEARLDEMAKRDAAPKAPPPPTLLEQISAAAPALSVIAPLAMAWMTGKNESERLERQQHQTLLTTMIQTATAPKPDTTKDLLTTLTPILGPMVIKMMDRNGPEQQAALFTAMSEQQFNQLQMMSQIIEANAPPQETPQGQMVRTMLEGLQRVVVAYATSKGGLPGQLPAAPSPAGMLGGAPQVQPELYATEGAASEVPEDDDQGTVIPAPSRRRQRRGPDETTTTLFSLLPQHFQTPGWKYILTELHSDPPMPADEMASVIAGHIEDLYNTKLLPPELQHIMTHPRETLEAIMERMPVAGKRPDYVREVLEGVLKCLQDDNYVTAERVVAARRASTPIVGDEEDEDDVSDDEEDGEDEGDEDGE